jgi:hypothetical protein
MLCAGKPAISSETVAAKRRIGVAEPGVFDFAAT